MTNECTDQPSTPVPLLEISMTESPQVDRDAGIIRSVKVLGRESRNGRTYSDQALEQASQIYEKLGVNIDHPDRLQAGVTRKFADRFGYLQGVHRRDDGVYGDLVYLKKHVLAEQICEAAERMPLQFGLSHNAEGYVTNDGDKTIVENITRVLSVDIVQQPATNRGLFESADADDTDGAPIVEHSRLEAGQKSAFVDPRQSPLAEHGSTSEPESKTFDGLRAKIRELEGERDVRQLLETMGVAAQPARIKALMKLESDVERTELIATWPTRTAAKPRSISPLFETTQNVSPGDAESFARAIR